MVLRGCYCSIQGDRKSRDSTLRAHREEARKEIKMEKLKQAITDHIIANAEFFCSNAKTAKGAHKFLMKISWVALPNRGLKARSYERNQGSKVNYITKSQEKRSKKYIATIPLDATTAGEVRAEVKAQFPRRQNWEATDAAIGEFGPICREINNGKYSSKCTYTHWTYCPVVGCWGFIKGSVLEFHFAGKITVLEPPAGYKWAKDKNGIHIISTDGRKDYHPYSDDLRTYSKAAIRSRAINNYTTRKAGVAEAKKAAKATAEQKKKESAIIRKAEIEGARICLADSLRAGNCKAGTENFAKRHNLNPAKHYRPTELLKIANGDANRVAIAVAVGLKRHRTEMSQGFCEIVNHVA